ncbi:MAG: hypothetical protein RL621_1538 [Bacteroidota bacterium]|jgi:FkbM family methyltransferase
MKTPIEKIYSSSTSLEECDFISTLFNKKDLALIKSGEKVIIYGAGSAGGEIYDVLQLHGVDVEFFCDKSADLSEKKLRDKLVISPKALCDGYKDRLVVIGVQKYKKEILNFLRNSGFNRIAMIESDEQFYYYLQFPRWKNNLENLKQDETLITRGYELMEDQISQEIFIKRLAILSSYADYRAYREYCKFSQAPSSLPEEKKIFASNFENEMYFNNDLIKLHHANNLVDCGAFDGDSLLQWKIQMQKENLTEGKAYCFEPDDANFKNLQTNVNDYKNVEIFNLGVWNCETTLEFASSETTFITESCVVEQSSHDKVIRNVGNTYIKANSIDNVIYPKKVDIIKMDVEGSEANALIGAKKTIQKWRPQLIISAYHKSSDLYNLPILINELCPQYKIYLRQYSYSWSETVLIAVM